MILTFSEHLADLLKVVVKVVKVGQPAEKTSEFAAPPFKLAVYDVVRVVNSP
jgi:hypothetical protein